MLEKIRTFFQTKAGAATAGIIALLSLLLAVFAVKSSFTSEAESLSTHRIYVDTNGKPFKVTIEAGVSVKAPDGGPAYPAELCYWTKDGKVKDSPTAVLLNLYVNKPGPTFCPDCGRLVVPNNPFPLPGTKPPPTKEEYTARHR